MANMRSKVLKQLERYIISKESSHPLKVAIDGIDAAGKTTLSRELESLLSRKKQIVITSSIDNFHYPREIRYRRGADSPEGYYRDSFDYQTLKSILLEPLGPDGNRQIRTSAFDHRKNTPTETSSSIAPEDAILLFDGIFLLRPELADLWDITIYVDINFDTCLQRALIRDLNLFGDGDELISRYRSRYILGQQIYLGSCQPKKHADIIMQNDNPEKPSILYR